MSSKKILYICQEIAPYLPENEVSVISRQVPQAIQERGGEIRTFMPRYGSVNERRNQLHEVIRLSGMNLIIDDNDHPLIIKVASIQSARMQVYFIDNDDFFHRKYTTMDENGEDFDDNDDRAIFYSRGVIETVRKLRWVPDIVHCHGWFSALAPLYIKKAFSDDPCFKNTKVVYSVYNNDFKKPFKESFSKKLLLEGIEDQDLEDIKTSTDYLSLSKLAIRFSDGVIQGSPVINPKVVAAIQESGKPFIVGSSEDNYATYDDFYNLLLDQKK